MEQFVKTTGIEITEGKVEKDDHKYPDGQGEPTVGSVPIGTYAPWVAWLKEYRKDHPVVFNESGYAWDGG